MHGSVELNLAASRPLRFAGFFTFYFAQGVPIGLLTIAMPAWLASQGVEAAQIASMMAITGIPWGVKLIAGPFMDRFSFPAMGWRRPWVMAAQGGLTLAMLSMSTVSDPVTELWTVIVIGFVINAFGALQDVAVDGMAIDVLPEDERGRANAFMACGQVAGFSGFGALNGFLLVQYGLPLTALVSALTVLLVFIFVTIIRERAGERLLPWSDGQAYPQRRQQPESFVGIFKDLIKVLFLPMALMLVLVEFFWRANAGIAITIFPVVATQELGFGADQYSYWVGLLGGVSAVVGILFGPLIDRFGAKRLLLIGFFGQACLTASFASLQAFWSHTPMVLSMMAAYELLGHLMFVAMIAAFMNICWKQVAATQFAVYMSLANLSRSIGAALFALVAAELTHPQTFYIMAVLAVIAGSLLLLFDEGKARARLGQLDVVNS